MRARQTILAAVAVAVVLFAALALSMGGPANVTAAPAAIPTPVSVNHAGSFADVPVFFSAQVVTADGGSNAQNIQNHQVVDLQWIIDQTLLTTMNTTTLKLQFSNDGSTWIDGATFATANVADAGDMQQYAIFGRYARVYADVSNTNPLTVTVIGVAK
jgi:hypothetical protein